MLHIYILSSRFRCFEPDVCRIWQQHLLDHFFYDMENKMAVSHDVFVQWRGVLAAYDEGLAKNDAVLAGALWRNVFKASEDVDIVKLAMIVSFMRRTLNKLDAMDDMMIMQAKLEFSSPDMEKELVAKKSKALEDTRPTQVKVKQGKK
ncbi:putative protein CBP3, mitochondrial [Glarea lozoyensis 74030]|uniref:Ubiquinol-cytochrome c chaperone domain-containing protein n=1 Tax=Glarea lozoyensis (strain ATCC 74030 / MF5533) TaxID=1104152 RepID=H0ELS2_GLAL7|nr:putative protein CBP3, mitochondrial [Glarea lozoyensis 74030]